MQSKNLLCALFFTLFCAGALRAQDIHFTQYYLSPLTLNPAQIGNFEGTARIGGIYRDQWSSVIRDQFSTPSAFVDAPIVRGFRKKDWIGIGAVLVSDRAGSAVLRRTIFSIGGSYHFALNKRATTYITLGLQYGNESRSVDRDRLRLEDHLLDNRDVQQSLDYNIIQEGDANFSDFNGGLMLTSKLNDRMDFNLGFSMFHLLEPEARLLNQGINRLPRRMLAHGQFNAKLNDRFTISPSFLYQTMSGADEIMVQGLAGYLFDQEKDITLNFGVSYRLRDAISPMVGCRYKNLTVGLAYDVNTSDLNQVSNYRGGFEIAANYIIKIYKPSVVKPKILCPRF